MISVQFSEVGQGSVDRAEMLLAGFPGAFDKALQSAMRRTAQHVRTETGRAVRKRYAITNADLRMDTAARLSYRYAPGSGVTAEIKYSGRKIPLYRYEGASPKLPTYSGDLVVAMVNGQFRHVHPGVAARGHQLRGTSPTTFHDAFVARFKSGHIGIFERTGGVTASGADEIKEIMGSSIPQMVGSDEVLRALSRDAAETFDKRIGHEVDAILNGWR